ncbi:MAG: hypothetical protein AAFU79_03815 [Myxococcota bacterium]
MSIDEEAPPLRAELPIPSEWTHVDLIRRTVMPYVAAAFDDDELSTRSGIMTGELLENAVKYGDWEQGDPRSFRIVMRGNERQLRVEVTNPVRDGAASLRKLIGIVDWINRFPSPRDAYLTRLIEVAEEDADSSQSGLGLVRLAYEAGCQLQVDLTDEGRTVMISGTIERAVEAAQKTKDLERLMSMDIPPELEIEVIRPVDEDPQTPARRAPVQLRWTGRACHDRPLSDFAPLLESLITTGCPGATPVELNLVALEDLASTSAAVIMYAAQKLLDSGREVIILYDSEQRWQRLTFEGWGRGRVSRALRFEAA